MMMIRVFFSCTVLIIGHVGCTEAFAPSPGNESLNNEIYQHLFDSCNPCGVDILHIYCYEPKTCLRRNEELLEQSWSNRGDWSNATASVQAIGGVILAVQVVQILIFLFDRRNKESRQILPESSRADKTCSNPSTKINQGTWLKSGISKKPINFRATTLRETDDQPRDRESPTELTPPEHIAQVTEETAATTSKFTATGVNFNHSSYNQELSREKNESYKKNNSVLDSDIISVRNGAKCQIKRNAFSKDICKETSVTRFCETEDNSNDVNERTRRKVFAEDCTGSGLIEDSTRNGFTKDCTRKDFTEECARKVIIGHVEDSTTTRKDLIEDNMRNVFIEDSTRNGFTEEYTRTFFPEESTRKIFTEGFTEGLPDMCLSDDPDNNQLVSDLKLPDPDIGISEETVVKGCNEFKLPLRDYSSGYPMITDSLSTQKLTNYQALVFREDELEKENISRKELESEPVYVKQKFKYSDEKKAVDFLYKENGKINTVQSISSCNLSENDCSGEKIMTNVSDENIYHDEANCSVGDCSVAFVEAPERNNTSFIGITDLDMCVQLVKQESETENPDYRSYIEDSAYVTKKFFTDAGKETVSENEKEDPVQNEAVCNGSDIEDSDSLEMDLIDSLVHEISVEDSLSLNAPEECRFSNCIVPVKGTSQGGDEMCSNGQSKKIANRQNKEHRKLPSCSEQKPEVRYNRTSAASISAGHFDDELVSRFIRISCRNRKRSTRKKMNKMNSTDQNNSWRRKSELKSLSCTSLSDGSYGVYKKKFCKVNHTNISKTNCGHKRNIPQNSYLGQGNKNKRSGDSKHRAADKKEDIKLSLRVLVFKDSGFISRESIQQKHLSVNLFGKLLKDCLMEDYKLTKPTSDFRQNLKVLQRFFADEERRVKKRRRTKEISRELHFEHSDTYETFGLSSYFRSLENGPPPPTRERMHYEWLRLASFHNYTGNGNAIALARNGFYHDDTEPSDHTRCYLCEASWSTWEMFDDVSAEHRRQSPDCPFHQNSGEESLNISITNNDSNEPTPSGGAASQSNAANSASVASLTAGADALSIAQQSVSANSSIEAVENVASDLQQTHINQTQIQNSGGESLPQQPTEERESRDRSLLALPKPRGQPGRPGHSYSTVMAPKRNNIAAGARSNVGLESSGNGSETSQASQLPGIRPSSILGGPVGAGAFASNPNLTGLSTSSQVPVSTATEAVQGSSAISAASAYAGGPGQAPGIGRGTDRSNTVVVNNPKHPDYRNIDTRISSYHGWPDYLDQTARQMAEAGFFFVGVADFTRCFCCGGGLRNWEPGDDPMLEHTRWFPRCEYVNKLKGEPYVAAVQRRHQEHMASQQQQQTELAQRRDQAPPNPMTTDAAAVLQEMGYSAERTREAILAVRQQTGSAEVSTQQVLTWLLDEEERRLNANTETSIETSIPGASSVTSAVSTTSITTTQVPGTASSSAELGVTTSEAGDKDTEAKQTGSSTAEPRQTGAVSNTSSSSGSGNVDKQSEDSDESKSAAPEDTTSTETSSKTTKKKSGKKKSKIKTGTKTEAAGATGGGLDAKSLKAENEKLREMQTCKICMEQPVNTTLLPCGHLVCCGSCASRLQRCPICRKRIKGTVKTFMS